MIMQAFVVTDFHSVKVTNKTKQMFLDRHASKRLKRETVERRAEESIIAVAEYLSRKAWEAGQDLAEI